jgi:hypothetical protein
VGDEDRETSSEEGVPAVGGGINEDFRDSFLKRTKINNGGSNDSRVQTTPRDSQLGNFRHDFGAKNRPKQGTITSSAQRLGKGGGVPARGTRGGGESARANPAEREALPGGFHKFLKHTVNVRERLNGCTNHSGPHHINGRLDFHFVNQSQADGSVTRDRLGGKVEDPANRTKLGLAEVLGGRDKLSNVRQHRDGLGVELTSSNSGRKAGLGNVLGPFDELFARSLPLHRARRRPEEKAKVLAVSLDLNISPFRDVPREPSSDTANIVHRTLNRGEDQDTLGGFQGQPRAPPKDPKNGGQFLEMKELRTGSSNIIGTRKNFAKLGDANHFVKHPQERIYGKVEEGSGEGAALEDPRSN